MKLESIGGRPLDYNVDKDVEKKGLYNDGQPTDELTAYDCLFDIEQYLMNDNEKAAIESARSDAAMIEELIAESEMERPNANEIGKNTINTPTIDKIMEENETHKMEPIQEDLFQAIGDNDEFDAKMQAELEALAEQFENEF